VVQVQPLAPAGPALPDGERPARHRAVATGLARLGDRQLTALARSTASVVLFLEHVPHTVRAWLGAAAGGAGAAPAYSFVERELRAGVAAMGARGLLHLDAHFDNLLTGGHRLYFAAAPHRRSATRSCATAPPPGARPAGCRSRQRRSSPATRRSPW